MLTEKEIEHLADLAKLELTGEEKMKLGKELSSILDYVQKLNEVDTSKVEPTAYALGLKNVMREDRRGEKPSKERSRYLLKQARELKDNHIKVKAIL